MISHFYQDPSKEKTHLNRALQSIKIILVGTTLPANIGAATRAMHTMGISKLALVSPKHPVDETSSAMAAGAQNILNNVLAFQDLNSALADVNFAIAISARQRSMPWPLANIRYAAEWIAKTTLPQNDNTNKMISEDQMPNIAIVFGREDRGLTNDELALCNMHATIPANPNYSSLNLAAAVQVVVYEIRQAVLNQEITKNTFVEAQHDSAENQLVMQLKTQWDEPAATHSQVQALQSEILNLAEDLQIFNPEKPRKTPQRLARLFARTQLDTVEYNFLRALINKTLKRLQ